MRRSAEIEFVVGAFGTEERFAEMELGVIHTKESVARCQPSIREGEVSQ